MSHFQEFTNIQINDKKTELKDARDLPTSKRKTHSASTPSIWKLIKLNKPEWPYAVLGSVGAVLAGMQAPLFALGITHVLTAFYSYDNRHIKHEVGKIALIFVGAAVVAIPIYLLQHYFYTLMGERLTTRVRLSMFSGFFFFFHTCFSFAFQFRGMSLFNMEETDKEVVFHNYYKVY